MVCRLTALALLSLCVSSFAITKSGHLSVVVNGYISLPAIQDVVFPEVDAGNVTRDQSESQSYNITTDYAPSSSTPNVQINATSIYSDAHGAYMTNNPSDPSADQKLYFTVSYHSCGTSAADYPLVKYNASDDFPTENIPNSQATTNACTAAGGTLSFTRLGVATGSAYPSAGLYLGTVSLTAQAAGS